MKTVSLGELVTIKGGGTPDRSIPKYWGGKIPWASVKDFKSNEINFTMESITDQGVTDSATNIIPAGNIIVPTRMAVGKAAINNIATAINQDLKALIPNGKTKLRYLLHALIAKADVLERQASGATVKGITLDTLRSLKIPLPPREEQKRIAAILDKANDIRRKRAESLKLLDELLRATFLDMFGDPATNPKRWPIKQLADIVAPETIVTYGIVQAGPEFPGGVPYIRTGDIKNGIIIEERLLRTSPEIASKFKRSEVKTGDLVMSIRATVGTLAIVPSSLNGANLTQGTAKISPGHDVDRKFLFSYINSESCQNWIQRHVKGATFREITLSKLREMPILFPDKSIQQKFSDICDKLEIIKNDYLNFTMEHDTLFHSLVARAFKGEL